MDLGSLKKISAPKAAPLVTGSPLAEELAPLLADDPAPNTLLIRLVDAGRLLEAARFLILALPTRETTWLACLAARLAAESTPLNERDGEALVAAEKWVFEPTEENRRAAKRALEDSEYSTPAALAAMAAFYSGGNVAAPDLPELLASPGVCAKLADAATALASIDESVEGMAARARRLLAQALDVAGGGSGRIVEV